MEKKGKLELTWVGKYEEKQLEPRILIEDEGKSYGDRDTENMLIHGDNLLALQALQHDYAGKIKCIYIDPPYNTGSAFDYYDDNLEHSIWLNMMKPRLTLLRNLLSDDGFIFVQIDDNEQAYLKVLLDEVFGRDCYVNQIIWKRRGGSANPSNRLNNVTDYILVYTKTAGTEMYPVYSKDDENTKKYIEERFRYVDENGRRYMKSPIQSPNPRPNLMYEYKGYRVPTKGWSISKEVMEKWDEEGRLAFPDDKSKTINRKIYLDEYKGQPISSLWTDIFVINPMSNERVDFDGQKPEALIQRVLQLSTKEGDWVLDSFLGSGSTAVTAQKMKRKWIGIELRDQAYTLCKSRIDSAIDGDQNGISVSVDWNGGGGYRFYELAEPLLVKHTKLPLYQINPSYTWEMICRAICKIEGFTYSLNGEFQGYSSENRYIHITDEFVSGKYVMGLLKSLGSQQSVLIYCKKHQADIILPANVEIKKIPKDLLKKCTFESEEKS